MRVIHFLNQGDLVFQFLITKMSEIISTCIQFIGKGSCWEGLGAGGEGDNRG